jgi:hypothetical protein
MRKTSKISRQTEEKRGGPLKTVPAEQAFHFYTGINQPTQRRAHNLVEFLEQIETINPSSLLFHQQRKDFKNWIQNALGERELAAKIEAIKAKDRTVLKTKLDAIVRAYLKQSETQVDRVSVQIAAHPRQITV